MHYTDIHKEYFKERYESIMFILTRNCNLDCEYCYETHESGFEVNIALVDGVLDKYDSDWIEFFGGEPLLNTEVIKHVLATRGDRRFNITTNGYLLTRLTTNEWEKFGRIGVSMDGVIFEDDVRTKSELIFSKIINNVKRLKSELVSDNIVIQITLPFGYDGSYSVVQRIIDINKATGVTRFEVSLAATYNEKDGRTLFTNAETTERFALDIMQAYRFFIQEGSPFYIEFEGGLTEGSEMECTHAKKSRLVINSDGNIGFCHVYHYNHPETSMEFDSSKYNDITCSYLEKVAIEEGFEIADVAIDSDHINLISTMESINNVNYERAKVV